MRIILFSFFLFYFVAEKEMKKKDIIKSSEEYTDIINKNKAVKNKYYSIYYQECQKENSRFGITIPKKLGVAVLRNKMKRRVKNIVDHNKNTIQNCYDYVIIVKREVLNLTYAHMQEELLKLMRNIGD